MTLKEIGRKDVIQLTTGEKLGRIDDLDFDTKTAEVKSLILRGRRHFFGLFGCDEDLIIPWCDIKNIGADVVMAETEIVPQRQPARRWQR